MKYDLEEILKCLCFVILGYFVAMIFSRMCSCGNGYKNGFRVGAAVANGQPCSAYTNEPDQCSSQMIDVDDGVEEGHMQMQRCSMECPEELVCMDAAEGF